MTASALLAELTCSGIRLEPRGSKLHVEDPGAAVTPEIRQRLIENKTALMALLKPDLPAGVSRAYKRLGCTLAEHPDIRTAVEVIDPDTGPVLLAVAVRGAGFVCLKAPQKRFDGFRLLELVHRWNREGGTPA